MSEIRDEKNELDEWVGRRQSGEYGSKLSFLSLLNSSCSQLLCKNTGFYSTYLESTSTEYAGVVCNQSSNVHESV